MKHLPESEANELLKEAELACNNSYSPYSDFPVGAAVRMKDGRVFRGTNVENASYGVTICAERMAIGNAIVHTGDGMNIEAIAIYSPTDSIAPCGACRQFIVEFGRHIVIIFKYEQHIIQKTMHELLPFEFTLPGHNVPD